MNPTNWNIDDFYSNLSSNIAEQFFAYDKKKLPIEDAYIPTCGVQGRQNIRVTNLILKITKKCFFKFVPGLPETEKLANHLWEELKESHTQALETRMTHFLREKNLPHDCVLVSTSEKTILFRFRVTSPAITQHPTHFKPLYHRLFNLLQEVRQGEFAVTHPSSSKPILATWHLVECVAFAAFNKTHKVAVLAHMDPCTDIPHFFSSLKALFTPLLKEPLIFEYVLLGGILESSFEQHRENIIFAAADASEENIQFKNVAIIGDKLPRSPFERDSWWCPSMRLHRSIAIDSTHKAPLESLLSYEPDINPNSSLHKRNFSLEEATSFENKRREEKTLKAVSCSLPSSAHHETF